MRKWKAVTGVMSCLFVVACGLLNPESGTLQGLEGGYTYLTMDGEWIKFDDVQALGS